MIGDDQDFSSNEAVMFVVQQTKYWRSISDHPHANYCLTCGVDISHGAEIHNLRILPRDTSDEEQLWNIVGPSDKHMRIQSKVKSNMCITMLVEGRPQAQPAQLMECGKFEKQRIELISEGADIGLMIRAVGGYILRIVGYSCETNSHNAVFGAGAKTKWGVL